MEEIKPLLRYFVKFEKEGKILPKEYPSDYAVRKPNQRSIIMIIYYKNIFFANNNRQKIWILESHNIFYSKKKIKGIIMSNFLLS